MKVSIDIDDELLGQARDLAARDGTTLSALVEQGLRQVLSERKQSTKPYKFHLTTFKGDGLTSEFRDAGWDKIRDAIYEDDGK